MGNEEGEIGRRKEGKDHGDPWVTRRDRSRRIMGEERWVRR